jgi:GH43 family beta-xylosidase
VAFATHNLIYLQRTYKITRNLQLHSLCVGYYIDTHTQVLKNGATVKLSNYAAPVHDFDYCFGVFFAKFF